MDKDLTALLAMARTPSVSAIEGGKDREPEEFPYWKLSLPPFADMLQNLRKDYVEEFDMNSKDLVVKRKFPTDTILSDGASNWFTEPARLVATFRDSKSPMERFLEMVAGMSSAQLDEYRSLSPYDQREKVYATGREANTFNPMLGVVLYRTLGAQGGVVFDPSAGWGDRAIAAAVSRAKRYIGYDPNPALAAPHQELAKSLSEITGTDVEFRPEGAPLDKWPESTCDCVFTSPPFFDLEVYVQSGEEGESEQSISGAPSYKKWVQDFLEPYYTAAYNSLRPGGWFAAYVEDANTKSGRIPIRSDTVDILKNLGAIQGPKFGLQVISTEESSHMSRASGLKSIERKRRKGKQHHGKKDRWIASAAASRPPRTRYALSWMKPATKIQLESARLFPIVIEEHSGVKVIRDDKLPVGTYTRVLSEIYMGNKTPKQIEEKVCSIYVGAPSIEAAATSAASFVKGESSAVFALDSNYRMGASNSPPIVAARAYGAHTSCFSSEREMRSHMESYCENVKCISANEIFNYSIFNSYINELKNVEGYSSIEDNSSIWVFDENGAIASMLAAAFPSCEIHAVGCNEDLSSKFSNLTVLPNGPETNSMCPVPFPSKGGRQFWEHYIEQKSYERFQKNGGDTYVWLHSPGGDWGL